jgi:linoleoyl-CoA desaturase
MGEDNTIKREIAELQASFRRLGFYRPAPVRIVTEFVYHLILTVIGLALWWHFESWYLAAGGLFISTLGTVGLATLAHTAAHGAALPWRRANYFLAYFGFPFMLMISLGYWRYKHNGLHHPNPNVIGVDEDCDLMPFFAMNEADIVSAGRWRRIYYRHMQGWVFPFAVTFNIFNIQRQSCVYLYRQLRAPVSRKHVNRWDVISIFLHIVVWVILPSVLISVHDAVILYIFRFILLGHFAFFILAPAHFPAEADLIVSTSEHDHVMRQLQGTLNFRTGVVGHLACSGLEFQIEHHLFPNICHVYYPRVAPLVRDFCQQNGYPYRTFRWEVAVVKSYAALFQPRPIRRPALRHEKLPAPIAQNG